MIVNILGTDYTIYTRTNAEDKYLKDRAGYCDDTSKIIVVCSKTEENTLDNFEVYYKETLRHEIVHAFMSESGLSNSWTHQKYGQEETVVDWIAIQAPKLFKAFQEAGCI
jgi:hypothetical protein